MPASEAVASWLDDGDVTLYHGDALKVLAELPACSVQTCVTSPPYWGLRDYGTGTWTGGDEACDHDERYRRRNVGAQPGSDSTKGAFLRDGPPPQTCPCGARRVDQQIGLEETPAEYVERLVNVFRGVWRVLRDDGTVWCNLGDSFMSGKQQAGIPWKVAEALRAPWYDGTIKREADRVWLAAMIDAEGCMFIHKRKVGQSNGQGYFRKSATFGAGLEVSSTDRVIVERCMDIAGMGSICEQTPEQNERRKQTIYRWNVRSNVCRELIRELYPHLVAKQHEARLLLGCPSNGQDAERAHESLKAIHQGGTPTIDFPAPASLFSPGWILRSDIIWAKRNCMPESVTDRPTKAHEYVFLLAKQPRYYWDADAVREDYLMSSSSAKHDARGSTSRSQAGIRSGAKGAALAGGAANGQRYGESSFVNQYANGGRNVRPVWEIATQPTPEAHFACVDEQTEALTPTGWKRHTDLADGDLIAMYDADADECRFAPASFHRYAYEGELVAIEKRDSSQRLTPNHRCYIRRRSGSVGIVRADELKPGMEILTGAPLRVDEIAVDGVSERLAALLGWYVAEGHENHDGYVTIYQSQSANPAKVDAIRRLLVGVGAEFHESERTRGPSVEVAFGVRGRIGAFLHGCGKQVGLDAIRLPHSQAESMLEAIIEGDGHRRSDGRSCIIQKDKTSLDRMQMLALRLGYRAVVSERKDGVSVLYLTRGRWLTLRGTNGAHTPIGREPYQGIVWCPRVETGLWLARRRGRPFITGNTYPEELVRRCILAGTSERGECSECGAPWVRQVQRQGGDTEFGDRPKRAEYGGAKTSTLSLSGNGSTEWARRGSKRIDGGWAPSCDCVRICGEPDSDDSYQQFACPHPLPCPRHPRDDDDASGVPPPVPQLVLDPFIGSGTTALVARKHGRRSIGIDLNSAYLEIAARRTSQLSLLGVGHAGQ